MELSRREFLKRCGATGLAVGFAPSLLSEIVKTLEQAAAGKPRVIWFQGASDAGCSISLLNTVHPSIAEVLLELISVNFHPNIMAASGDLAIGVLEEAVEKWAGEFFLVVEGAIPTANNGSYCTVGELGGRPVTALDWVKSLGAKAQATLAIGTCATFGGIPAGNPNPTGCKSVGDVFKENGIRAPVINIPGCPPYPDWIVGTLVHLLKYGIPELDSLNRPLLFFSKPLHDRCERLGYYQRREFAKKLGDAECLFWLGCKGPYTYADCSSRLWLGANWCVKGGAPCIGCANPGFPDRTSPFYYYEELAKKEVTANV